MLKFRSTFAATLANVIILNMGRSAALAQSPSPRRLRPERSPHSRMRRQSNRRGQAAIVHVMAAAAA